MVDPGDPHPLDDGPCIHDEHPGRCDVRCPHCKTPCCRHADFGCKDWEAQNEGDRRMRKEGKRMNRDDVEEILKAASEPGGWVIASNTHDLCREVLRLMDENDHAADFLEDKTIRTLEAEAECDRVRKHANFLFEELTKAAESEQAVLVRERDELRAALQELVDAHDIYNPDALRKAVAALSPPVPPAPDPTLKVHI